MNATKIEWTDRTWNPTTGCTKVSPGCDHCYAEGIAHRFAGSKAFPEGFEVTLHPERLDAPLRWRKPGRVFVNSMSDLFHDDVPDEFIARMWAVMAVTQQHTYQVLTKRHGRMRSVLGSTSWPDAVDLALRQLMLDGQISEKSCAIAPRLQEQPLPNVWLGVSVEDQKRADLRIPALLDTPAAVRFLSCEPLLGPVDLDGYLFHQWGERWPREELHWVIVGGESGPSARPMHPAWARHLRDQCQAVGVPFFFKQHGEWSAGPPQAGFRETDHDVRGDGYHWPIAQPHGAADGTEVVMRRVGKKAAGRELDGRTWDEFPTDHPRSAA